MAIEFNNQKIEELKGIEEGGEIVGLIEPPAYEEQAKEQKGELAIKMALSAMENNNNVTI